MARKKIYLIAGKFHGALCLRFVVCSRLTLAEDITFAWKEIQSQADVLLSNGTKKIKSIIDMDKEGCKETIFAEIIDH